MKIHPSSGLTGLFGTQAGGPARRPSQGPADRVEVSERARLVARFRAAAGQEDAVRAARIERIRQAVASGTYQVPAQRVAEALLQSGAMKP